MGYCRNPKNFLRLMTQRVPYLQAGEVHDKDAQIAKDTSSHANSMDYRHNWQLEVRARRGFDRLASLVQNP